MAKLKFICENCKGTELEVVETDIVRSTPIYFLKLDNDEYTIEYNHNGEETHDGYIDRFQCSNCGNMIKDECNEPIQNEDELAYWLKDQPYNKEVRHDT